MATQVRTDIILDNAKYPLARQALTERTLGPSARRWSMTPRPKGTTVIARENVLKTEVEDEYVIVYNDWSKGVTGDHDPRPGTVHICQDVSPTTPGQLSSTSAGISSLFNAFGEPYRNPFDIAGAVYFVGSSPEVTGTYVAAGAFCYRIDAAGKVTWVREFGVVKFAKDICVWNGELVVAFGDTENHFIEKMSNDGVWSMDDDVYADHFAVVEDRLWRSFDTNKVSNIGPGEDPFIASNWSSGITVGDDDVPITKLLSYGERLAVCKENGLFLGDANTIFPNVFPQFESKRNSENGKKAVSVGSRIFYNAVGGRLLVYEQGAATEAGLAEILTSTENEDNIVIPGVEISAMCPDGEYVWIATKPSMMPLANPTAVFATRDFEVTYTDGTANMIDNDTSTTLSWPELNTTDDGHYVIIGYSKPFYGVLLQISTPNSKMLGLLTQARVAPSDGTWTNQALSHPVIDETKSNETYYYSATLNKPGFVWWQGYDPTKWKPFEINGVTGYFIRLGHIGTTLSEGCAIAGVRVITQQPIPIVYRVRQARTGDNAIASLVWEPIFSHFNDPKTLEITSMSIAPYAGYGAARGNQLIMCGYGGLFSRCIDNVASNDAITASNAGRVILPKDDAGMPFIDKQWLDITVKGKTIDTSHAIDICYREDETTTWDTGQSNVNVSPASIALSGVTGKALQLRVDFDATTDDALTEVNEIQVRFRTLDTYKSEYTMILEINDEGYAAATKLAALRALVGGGIKTLIDPLGTSKRVTVSNVREVEYLSEGVDYPVMMVELKCCEI